MPDTTSSRPYESPSLTRVLVIEDEESVRFAIEVGLQTIGGYEVTTAHNGRQGLDVMESARPDVLLLDLTMPVLDGMEVLRELRTRSNGFRPRRVVLMTAHSNPVPSGKLNDLGLDAVLAKPFRLNELAAAVAGEGR